MTIILDLPPDVEKRLRQQATREGEDTQAVALRLLSEQMALEILIGPSYRQTQDGIFRHAALLCNFLKRQVSDAVDHTPRKTIYN